jgi:hypothetical protein
MTPNHHERQFMQWLEGRDWVKAFTLPPSPKVVEGLLAKGWIEESLIEKRPAYRVTEKGLAAKKMPIRI